MWYIERDDILCHHGILGQKWGVRRFQNEDGTLTEEGKKKKYSRVVGINKNVAIYEQQFRGLGRIFGKGKSSGMLDIYNRQGEKVGNIMTEDTNHNAEHLDWIGIDDKHQRKHYGQDALDLYIKDCIKRGKKVITLEAAGLDKAAKHIYEKVGFVQNGKTIVNKIWDNLDPMELHIDNFRSIYK